MLDLHNPEMNWMQIASGLGVEASRATTAEEFAAQYESAMKQQGTAPDRSHDLRRSAVDTIDALRAIVGETGVLSAADIATRSAGFLRSGYAQGAGACAPKGHRGGFEGRSLVP